MSCSLLGDGVQGVCPCGNGKCKDFAATPVVACVQMGEASKTRNATTKARRSSTVYGSTQQGVVRSRQPMPRSWMMMHPSASKRWELLCGQYLPRRCLLGHEGFVVDFWISCFRFCSRLLGEGRFDGSLPKLGSRVRICFGNQK